MIAYRPCSDLQASAKITYRNMKVYYDQFAPEWDEAQVLEQISNLDNWDVLHDGKVVGALRTSLEGNYYHLRDIQVSKEYQNKGIGAEAIGEASRLAALAGAAILALKVFKNSPASALYLRQGFHAVREDDRFLYMEREVRG